jgi:hypothetical protein
MRGTRMFRVRHDARRKYRYRLDGTGYRTHNLNSRNWQELTHLLKSDFSISGRHNFSDRGCFNLCCPCANLFSDSEPGKEFA